MPAPLSIGLIGCGRIARLVHLGALRAADGVRLAALADPDPQRLHEAAQQAPAAVPYASAEALLEKSGVEAVVIAAPPAQHAPLAVAAFAAGKHVYVEKPLAAGLGDAEAIRAAQRAAGTVGMVGFSYRFHPLHRAAKARLAAGALGEVVAARSVFSAAARAIPDWKARRASGGGVLLDLASHHIDLVRFLFEQEVAEVSATVTSGHSEGDTAALQLRLESGLPVQTLVSMRSVTEDRVEVYGEAGRLSYDRQRSVELDVQAPGLTYGRRGQLQRTLGTVARAARRLPRVPQDPSFRAAFEAFARAARGGPHEGADLDDGLRSLAVVLAAEASAADGGRAVRPEPLAA